MRLHHKLGNYILPIGLSPPCRVKRAFSGGTNLNIKSSITLLFCLALIVCSAGCGGNELQSITVTSDVVSINGIGGFAHLTVMANYSNTSKVDVTTHATYSIAPPTGPAGCGGGSFCAPPAAVTINASGIIQAVQGACTWTVGPIIPPATTPGPSATNPYIVTVSFGGMTSTQFISVGNIAGCPHP